MTVGDLCNGWWSAAMDWVDPCHNVQIVEVDVEYLQNDYRQWRRGPRALLFRIKTSDLSFRIDENRES